MSTYTIDGAHTTGNLLRATLLQDPAVLVASYRVEHPLQTHCELYIETKRGTPDDSLQRAKGQIVKELDTLEKVL